MVGWVYFGRDVLREGHLSRKFNSQSGGTYSLIVGEAQQRRDLIDGFSGGS